MKIGNTIDVRRSIIFNPISGDIALPVDGEIWYNLTTNKFRKHENGITTDLSFSLPALTAGSVLFSDGSTIAQDNANLFWDNTNNRLGIGTTTPSTKLHVYSASDYSLSSFETGSGTHFAEISVVANNGSSNAYFRQYGSSTSGTVFGASVASSSFFFTNGSAAFGVGTYSSAPLILGMNNTEVMRLHTNGNVGIGTTSPTAVLHLKAGTAAAGGAPLKFTSGALLTTAEAGAVEFLTDAYYGTITTGGTRKTFAFLESPVFTTSIQTPTIELGHATDTTLSRVSAGVIAVEGVTVPTISSTSTLTNKTLITPLLTVLVEANTAVAASPNIITSSESNTIYTNEGATVLNYHTLPTAVAGLIFTFYVDDVDGIRVTANTGDIIQINGVASAAAGYAECTAIGGSITVVAINATDWCCTSVVGTWTLV